MHEQGKAKWFAVLMMLSVAFAAAFHGSSIQAVADFFPGGTSAEVHNQSLTSSEKTNIQLLHSNSTWRYLDNGSDQGTAWRTTEYNDSAWNVGMAPLGYPVFKTTSLFGGIRKTISYGANSSMKHRTSYFRTAINVSDLADYSKIIGTFGMDDGVILYVNGQEVYRYNMPEGEANDQTLSSATVEEPVTETADLTQALKEVLHEGVNTFAAEVISAATTALTFTGKCS
ncbi:hypothetical protein J23TS9_41230 [Paenibacillus sp. J23TS9]|uniref:hypothetical protein n=1 Tax=Paenibacillus sp. J23TS9 TaxID=2807193 RepID=UPI001B2D1401|nr:hypothetical protein [Paenibacillus sp. J23TS9]GIP28993.1 hypothetical protein J23TS9_41230 [Paenibacillus sp. J23TS9]